jgi:hypothetical protein
MNGREYRGCIVFYIHETGYDVLVGLPDILQYFPDFMASQILLAAGRISESEVVGLMSILTDYLYNPDGQPLLYPWSDTCRDIAPEEDLDDIDPCVHPSLAYLSKPFDSFCDDFYASLLSHMPDADFRQRPGIQAAIAGSRPVVHESSLAAPVSIGWANIEKSYDIDRQQWLIEICHTEYTVEELRTGLWLKRIASALGL